VTRGQVLPLARDESLDRYSSLPRRGLSFLQSDTDGLSSRSRPPRIMQTVNAPRAVTPPASRGKRFR